MDCSGHLCAAPEKCLSNPSYPLLFLSQESLWPSSQALAPHSQVWGCRQAIPSVAFVRPH